MMGVEPTSQPWEGHILPMYYTRICYIINFYLFFVNLNLNIFTKEMYCHHLTNFDICLLYKNILSNLTKTVDILFIFLYNAIAFLN